MGAPKGSAPSVPRTPQDLLTLGTGIPSESVKLPNMPSRKSDEGNVSTAFRDPLTGAPVLSSENPEELAARKRMEEVDAKARSLGFLSENDRIEKVNKVINAFGSTKKGRLAAPFVLTGK